MMAKKQNVKGEVVQYKARWVAKGHTQIYGQDYGQTYSPIMDAITYRYLIVLGMMHNLVMNQIDVVTTYLYGILDTKIYMTASPKLLKRVAFHI
jgi:hypothetical protein